MRILHTADLHLGLTRYSTPGTTSRSDDFANTLMRFADRACDLKVDVAIMAGDLFHTRRPVPRDILALMKAINRLQDRGITTLIAPGNHDGMDAVGDPRTHALSWMSELPPTNVHVFTEPFSHYLHDGTGAFGVVAVPYPHRRSFDVLMPDATPEERTEEISRRLENAIEVMYDKVAAMGAGHEPIIFVGHLSTLGAALGTEVTMRFGWDVAIRAALLDRFDYAALGHIHKQQQVGASAWYAGSPEYMDFGEEGQPKGFILANVQRGKPPVIEVIDSEPRVMQTIEIIPYYDEYEGATLWPEADEDVAGSIVRMVVRPVGLVAADARTPDFSANVTKLARDYRAKGATYVQTEVRKPDVSDSRVRVKMDAFIDDKAALEEWLIANNFEVEPVLSVGAELMNRLKAGEPVSSEVPDGG